jgi:hypothetical protein
MKLYRWWNSIDDEIVFRGLETLSYLQPPLYTSREFNSILEGLPKLVLNHHLFGPKSKLFDSLSNRDARHCAPGAVRSATGVTL